METVAVTRTSILSGETNTWYIRMNTEDMYAYANGALVQRAFPYLSDDEREFIKTGITPEEWETLGEEE